MAISMLRPVSRIFLTLVFLDFLLWLRIYSPVWIFSPANPFKKMSVDVLASQSITPLLLPMVLSFYSPLFVGTQFAWRRTPLPSCFNHVSVALHRVYMLLFKVIDTFASRFPAKLWVSWFTIFVTSLVRASMSIFTFGVMVLHDGNERNCSGSKNRKENGLVFNPGMKKTLLFFSKACSSCSFCTFSGSGLSPTQASTIPSAWFFSCWLHYCAYFSSNFLSLWSTSWRTRKNIWTFAISGNQGSVSSSDWFKSEFELWIYKAWASALC